MHTFLVQQYPQIAEEIRKTISKLQPGLSATALANQAKVLRAFSQQNVASHNLQGSTGYGYNDEGREKLEAIFSQIFGGEAALVRPQIASGTHALWLALAGNVGPGEEIVSITGKPYATLDTVVKQKGPGTLDSLNIKFRSLDLLPDGAFNLNGLAKTLTSKTQIIYIQKSRGYSLRHPVSTEQIGKFATWLKNNYPNPPAVVVDNCYGEFVETKEPCHGGADLTVGSLIKNPGGGLAETGGYMVGRQELVDNVADRLLAPGLHGEIGATGTYLSRMYQGLFLAPHFVGQAVYNARYAALLAEQLGFKTFPRWDQPRFDLVQAIELGSEDNMDKFCQGIQAASPVDSFVAPVPGEVPGYQTPVIMAAGTFIQGASLELTADGPVEAPYIVYYQGGLGAEHGLLAITHALAKIFS